MNNEYTLKLVNLMWVDIAGSDYQMKRLGITTYAKKLEQYYEIVDILASKFGIYMVDTLGDGISFNTEDTSVDSLINAFFAMKTEINASLNLDVKAGIHSGNIATKNIILSSGMKIPLVAGAINEAFRLESFCKVNRTNLLLSPEAYSRVSSTQLKESFVLSKGKYKRKNTFFAEVYKYAKFF